ncbi:MAG: hypothetical protein WAT19_10075 [Ferruginibacter sp.]
MKNTVTIFPSAIGQVPFGGFILRLLFPQAFVSLRLQPVAVK